MHPSSTLYVGMEVHQESIAVAYVANDHDAASSPWGPSTPDSVTLIR
jgi:hypothetical protein